MVHHDRSAGNNYRITLRRIGSIRRVVNNRARSSARNEHLSTGQVSGRGIEDRFSNRQDFRNDHGNRSWEDRSNTQHPKAVTAPRLDSAASDGITGKLISALWDPWEKLRDFRAELEGSDIYTLRRIVPEDRGKKF